jgi:hypothetical protein
MRLVTFFASFAVGFGPDPIQLDAPIPDDCNAERLQFFKIYEKKLEEKKKLLAIPAKAERAQEWITFLEGFYGTFNRLDDALFAGSIDGPCLRESCTAIVNLFSTRIGDWRISETGGNMNDVPFDTIIEKVQQGEICEIFCVKPPLVTGDVAEKHGVTAKLPCQP